MNPSAFVTGTAASVFNFNGGTLLHTSDEAGSNMFGGFGTANGLGGGVIINTADGSPSINQSFVHSTIVGDPVIDGGLTKQGNRDLILSGASTYNGPTNVNAGRLFVTNTIGSATGTGTVSVAKGATLLGNGRIAGPVTINSGGQLSPGVGYTGMLFAASGVTLNAGSVFDISLGGTVATSDYPQLQSGGVVALNGATLQLSLRYGYLPKAGDAYTIITDVGTTGTFGTQNTVQDNYGDTYSVVYTNISVILTAQTIVVPEPTTWMLLVVGLPSFALLARWRTVRSMV